MDVLVKSITLILDDVYVHEDNISDFEYDLVEPSITIHIARNSLATPMIEDMIEHKTVDTSVFTSSKLSESPHADVVM